MNAFKKAAIVLTLTSSTLFVAGPAMAAPTTHSAAATASVTTNGSSVIAPPCVGCW